MPVREKATKGPARARLVPSLVPVHTQRAAEPRAFPPTAVEFTAERRLPAGGKWIRTPSPTSQATYGGGRISAKNKAGLPSQAGPKERKRASKGLTRASAKVGAVLGATGKEIELRGGHQIGPISASGIAVSCLGGLRGPENRAPFLVRLSSIRSDMTRIVAG